LRGRPALAYDIRDQECTLSGAKPAELGGWTKKMAQITTRDLCPAYGAEVFGVDARVPLDTETCRTLRKLFDERSLLLFRDMADDLKFQTYLTEILMGRDVPDPDALVLLEKSYVSNKEPDGAAPFGRLLYHSDQMWSPNDRVDVLSLYGKEIEQPATPTLFISAVDGWDTLPKDLRERVKDRVALQCYDVDTYKKRAAGDPDVLISTYNSSDASVVTPIAYRHPRTGRTILYVCQQTTQKIEGMTSDESNKVIDALLDHLYAPGKELAHYWRKNDLVYWDNLALQHARPNVVTAGPARTLRKTFGPLPQHALRPDYASAAGS
jgi:alpha-ketoglutarate-dependent taurine dioxygenase